MQTSSTVRGEKTANVSVGGLLVITIPIVTYCFYVCFFYETEYSINITQLH